MEFPNHGRGSRRMESQGLSRGGSDSLYHIHFAIGHRLAFVFEPWPRAIRPAHTWSIDARCRSRFELFPRVSAPLAHEVSVWPVGMDLALADICRGSATAKGAPQFNCQTLDLAKIPKSPTTVRPGAGLFCFEVTTPTKERSVWLDCELRLNAQLFTLSAKRAANKAEAQEQHEPRRRLRHRSCNSQNADEVAG